MLTPVAIYLIKEGPAFEAFKAVRAEADRLHLEGMNVAEKLGAESYAYRNESGPFDIETDDVITSFVFAVKPPETPEEGAEAPAPPSAPEGWVVEHADPMRQICRPYPQHVKGKEALELMKPLKREASAVEFFKLFGVEKPVVINQMPILPQGVVGKDDEFLAIIPVVPGRIAPSVKGAKEIKVWEFYRAVVG